MCWFVGVSVVECVLWLNRCMLNVFLSDVMWFDMVVCVVCSFLVVSWKFFSFVS